MKEAGPRKGRRADAPLVRALVIGAATFLIGVLGSRPERAWQAYHVNFVFWIGVSFGGVLFSAVQSMADGWRGRPDEEALAEAFGTFLPVACILFGILYFGREHVFPWIHHPRPEIAGWLNMDFLFLRDGRGDDPSDGAGSCPRSILHPDRPGWGGRNRRPDGKNSIRPWRGRKSSR